MTEGRPPKEECLTSLLQEGIEKPVPTVLKKDLFLEEGATWHDAAVRSLLLNTVKGNATALKEVWERLDGKVPQPKERPR